MSVPHLWTTNDTHLAQAWNRISNYFGLDNFSSSHLLCRRSMFISSYVGCPLHSVIYCLLFTECSSIDVFGSTGPISITKRFLSVHFSYVKKECCALDCRSYSRNNLGTKPSSQYDWKYSLRFRSCDRYNPTSPCFFWCRISREASHNAPESSDAC